MSHTMKQFAFFSRTFLFIDIFARLIGVSVTIVKEGQKSACCIFLRELFFQLLSKEIKTTSNDPPIDYLPRPNNMEAEARRRPPRAPSWFICSICKQ